MKPPRFSAIAVTCACVAVLISQTVRAQFQDLARHVPASANALVLVNAKKLMDSPVAQAQNWKTDRAKRFAAGVSNVPPLANQLLIAAQLDLESMQPIWEAALMQVDAVPPLPTVAKQYEGTIDSVADLFAVRLPDDSYIVQFSQQMVGMLAPGNRQLVARWIREPASGLSAYLQESVGYADRGAEVIMALDLADVVTVEEMQEKIEAIEDEAIKNSTIDKKELAQVLASIKGLTLGITFGEQVFGKIKVDFGRDAAVIAPIAKPLLLEVISKRGAMIDEFADWKASVEGTRVSLGGNLTASGLTRLSSLIELPTQALNGERQNQQASSTAQAAPPPAAQATQEYFQAIDHVFNDLRGRKGEAKSIGQIGLWFDNYARKVDRLPMLNVDDQMLDYGAYVAEQLRNSSMAIKGIGIRTRVGEVNAVSGGVSGSSYRYGRYGAYDASWTRGMGRREQQSARTQVRAQEKATGAVAVQEIRQQIQQATAQIRRAMTEKYQIQF